MPLPTWLSSRTTPCDCRDEAVKLTEAKAGALAVRLGREERLERMFEHIRRHAAAGVRDCDAHIVAGLHPFPSAGIRHAQRNMLGLNTEVPPSSMASRALMARLSIALSNWLGSQRTGQQPSSQSNVDPDFKANRPLDEVFQALDEIIEVDQFRIEWLSPAKSKQPACQRGGTIGGGDRQIQELDHGRVGGQAHLGQRYPACDALKHVVEVMRDAAGKLSDGLDLLRLAERFLRFRQGPSPVRAQP